MSRKRPDMLIGERQRDGAIWHGESFHHDVWTLVADDLDLPCAPAVVTKTRWLAETPDLIPSAHPLGLLLEPHDRLDDIAGDLSRFALICLSFPKFSDGRPFSLARLVREKHGYAGEVRAVGRVLLDQIPLMQRLGFDSFAVAHEPTRRALAADQLARVDLFYQPAVREESPVGTRPWLRRAGAVLG